MCILTLCKYRNCPQLIDVAQEEIENDQTMLKQIITLNCQYLNCHFHLHIQSFWKKCWWCNRINVILRPKKACRCCNRMRPMASYWMVFEGVKSPPKLEICFCSVVLYQVCSVWKCYLQQNRSHCINVCFPTFTKYAKKYCTLILYIALLYISWWLIIHGIFKHMNLKHCYMCASGYDDHVHSSSSSCQSYVWM